ncbi:inositol monophosphatase family protein [Natrialbaceae archaeon AArc-T1-2]|uniref:inositol monophosphatase family protein n=1 Tax=Natrialbaceae archaeon AArc-T1-2 TaxID=3053904 RepID=UPI00255AAEC0|nr:inositol monophosphatase [Natrialbaceae archaeon AArc-T1-2]WIV66133.1 inositol monophosphatase [Natrialbaceae archaeon AArc-T1-2]
MSPDRRADLAVRAAEAGAAVALESFRADLEVERKDENGGVVTQADRDAQRAVVETIREEYPEEAIVGEEEGELSAVPEREPAWIVDPIDGTDNYVRGSRLFGTAVAAVDDGEPVASAVVFPALSEAYRFGPNGVVRNGDSIATSDRTDPETSAVCPLIWWGFDRREEYAAANRAIVERFGDLRRLGCAQATLAAIADGTYEGAITNVETNAWDTVAGVAMIRAAGGTVTDLEGERWRHDSRGLVASNGTLHEDLLAAAREIDGHER